MLTRLRCAFQGFWKLQKNLVHTSSTDDWPEVSTLVGVPIDPVLVLPNPELVDPVVRKVHLTRTKHRSFREFSNARRCLLTVGHQL